VRDIRKIIITEFNIEGYPSERFLKLIAEIRPDRRNLVPDPPEANYIFPGAGIPGKTKNSLLK